MTPCGSTGFIPPLNGIITHLTASAMFFTCGLRFKLLNCAMSSCACILLKIIHCVKCINSIWLRPPPQWYSQWRKLSFLFVMPVKENSDCASDLLMCITGTRVRKILSQKFFSKISYPMFSESFLESVQFISSLWWELNNTRK